MIVSPSASVAVVVTFTLLPSITVAIFPAAVVQVGDTSTLISGADNPNKPDEAVNFTLYGYFELTNDAFGATAVTCPVLLNVVEDALKTVHDPEIPVNIFDLGLIYDVDRRQNGDVYITMSLTAPGCPVAGEMPGQVASAVAAADGVGAVSVELVWSPPWTPERMSDDARLALDF